MKKKHIPFLTPLMVVLFILLTAGSCLEPECDYQINYEQGIFPEDPVNLEDINTSYDDYNSTIPSIISNSFYLLFSSNRGEPTFDYNITPSLVYFEFDQTLGEFQIAAFDEASNMEPFYTDMATHASSDENDFGPYFFYAGNEGNNYFLTTREVMGTMDVYFFQFGPYFPGQYYSFNEGEPLSLINTNNSESYATYNNQLKQLFYCSDQAGSTDIYVMTYSYGEGSENLQAWFRSDVQSAFAIDSINTSAEEKCPYVVGNRLYFASNMEGGYGGYDLYYSDFVNNKWSSPVNMGETINTEQDEFRPVVAAVNGFSNQFMIFSSNREGGAGGFDLYFAGIDRPL